MSLNQNQQPGMGRHVSSHNQAPGPPPGLNSANQQHQGTPTTMETTGWQAGPNPSPPFSYPHYEPTPNCISCLTLGSELHSARYVNVQLCMKLSSVLRELDQKCSEVLSCHEKIKTLEEDILQYKEKSLHLEKQRSELNKKCFDLEQNCSQLQEKEKLFKAQPNLSVCDCKDSTISLIVNNDLVDTSSKSEESSSESGERSNAAHKPAPRNKEQRQDSGNGTFKRNEDSPAGGAVRNAPRMETHGSWTSGGRGHQRESDHGGNLTQENRVGYRRPNQGFYQAREGNAWNSKEVRPNGVQARNVPVETTVNSSSSEKATGNISACRPGNGQNQPSKMHDRGPLAGKDFQEESTEQWSSYRNSKRVPVCVRSDTSSYPNLIKEIKCDLFDMPDEFALAHCVGSDLIMSSGVAVHFRKKFRCVPELLDQNKNPGDVAFLITGTGQHVYYLVTKLTSTGKPTWENFEKSVIQWSNLCSEHGVKKVAIPRIGCGRDQLDWSKVANLLNKNFANKGIEIVVCIIEFESAPENKKWSLKLCHSKEPLSLLDPVYCALVFIGSKDHFITESIRRLATKYGFLSDYSTQQLCLGSLYEYRNKATRAHIFGLVVKESHKDPVNFVAIGKCLQYLRRAVKKLNLYYMGFEAFDDPKFPIVTRKMWTVIIDTFFVEDIEVYFCWPEGITEKNWEEQRSY